MKRLICLALTIVTFAITMSSCSNKVNDPMDLALLYEGKGYYVQMIVDDETIKEVADDFEIRAAGIYCMVAVIPDNGDNDEELGVFLYCDSNDVAKNVFEDLNKFADSSEDFKEDYDRGIVEKSNTVVFIGCEDPWEELE